MRTTITLDDDIAVLLDGLRQRRGLTLKQAVNDALRLGLTRAAQTLRPRTRHHTKALWNGRLLVPSLDNIALVLAEAEGERYR